MTDTIVITGCGAVSAPGAGVEPMRRALLDGRSGLAPLTRFESPRCGHFPVAEARDVGIVGGESRTVTLGRLALAEALRAARWSPIPSAVSDRAALVVGTCVGGMPETEDAVAAVLAGGETDAGVWRRHECGATTHALADEFGFFGPATTVSNACSSGAQAIAMGAELLLAGVADVVAAGGTDALCRLTLNGFASLLAMDTEGCRPFDRSRKGMSLGEGAGFLVLERARDAAARGVRPVAVLSGWAEGCDAFHTTAPEPDGRGAEAAMTRALDAARVAPSSVGYVNAHGTGTIDNDRAEGRAMRRLFEEQVPPFSSTKRIFGHTLAAAGALEAIVCVLAIRDGFIPGNVGFREPDAECGVAPVVRTTSSDVRCAMSSSFGFGGNNTVLVFSAVPHA